jgi:DNA-directed RNA polymerase specialized sigma24 family protein
VTVLGQHFARLLKLLRRRGHSHEDAEDLIQDAFLSLHTYCQRAEVRSDEAFLVRAVLNRSVSHYRSQIINGNGALDLGAPFSFEASFLLRCPSPLQGGDVIAILWGLSQTQF